MLTFFVVIVSTAVTTGIGEIAPETLLIQVAAAILIVIGAWFLARRHFAAPIERLVAQLRAAEDATRQAKAELGSLVDILPGSFFELRTFPDGNKRFSSLRGFATFGQEGGKAEWIAPDRAELPMRFHEDDRDLLFVEVPRRLRTEGRSVHRFRLNPPNGKIEWLQAFEALVGWNGDIMISRGIAFDITAEMAATAALKAALDDAERSKAELNALVDSLPGILIDIRTRADGRKFFAAVRGDIQWLKNMSVDFVNAPACPEAPEREAKPEFYPPDDRHLLFDQVPKAVSKAGYYEFRHRAYGPNGEVTWFASREYLLGWDGDTMISRALSLDITAEVEATEKLKAAVAAAESSRAELNALIDTLPGALIDLRTRADGRKFVTTIRGGASWVRNPRTATSRTALEGRESEILPEFFHPDDRHMLYVLLPKAVRERGYHEFRHRTILPDGGIAWLSSREYLLGWDGDTMLSRSLSLDVTREVEAEGARLETERRYRELVENLPVAIFEDDLKTGDFFASALWQAWTGLSPKNIKGKEWLRALHPPEVAPFLAWRRATIQQGSASPPRELRVIHTDRSERTILVNLAPRRDATGAVVGLIGTGADVTELRELQDHMRQTERLEMLGQIAGGVVHDFNNTLGAIQAFAGMITDDLTLDANPATRSHAERILLACRRAKALTDQILGFARKGDPSLLQPFDLATATRAFAPLLMAGLPSTVELRLSIDASTPPIMAAPGGIEQILLNLVINAGDALAGRRGTVTVAVEPFDPQSRAAERFEKAALATAVDGISFGRHADGVNWLAFGEVRPRAPFVSIIVADDADGIEPSVLTSIFRPFFTTKPEGRGTGLGLATVRRTVLSHHGALLVETERGKGTSFHVLLPTSDMPAARQKEMASISPARPDDQGAGTDSITVLLVDDDVDFGEMIAAALEHRHFDVALVPDPHLALASVREDVGLWDVIVVDHNMPHMLGTELIRHIGELDHAPPCVLCTGNVGFPMPDDAPLPPGLPVLRKPFDIEELIDAIVGALHGRNPPGV